MGGCCGACGGGGAGTAGVATGLVEGEGSDAEEGGTWE